MKNISKRFAAWVTSFKHKPFLQARLKLTAYYTLGISVILAIFNFGVYGLFVNDIRDITGQFNNELSKHRENEDIETRIIDQAEDRLETALYTVDTLAIVLAAGLSYYLAGLALRPIEESYKRQRKFVADSAHELRTPLAVMKAGVETVLSEEATKEDYKKIIDESLEELYHLSAIVDDLLFLARSDDLKKVEFTKLDLGYLAHRQIELMQPYAKTKEIDLQDDIEGEFYTEGNKAYLKRLLANLIQNAIDYNKPKGEVAVSLQKNKGQVELKIIDTGIGISNDDLKHIFDRFYKADRARTKGSSGAGLGLSIVQEIVKLHKGRITVQSELDEGTAVHIFFPIA
jgi:signal transduction histidine kinase